MLSMSILLGGMQSASEDLYTLVAEYVIKQVQLVFSPCIKHPLNYFIRFVLGFNNS
jgi:hypothetical protein